MLTSQIRVLIVVLAVNNPRACIAGFLSSNTLLSERLPHTLAYCITLGLCDLA